MGIGSKLRGLARRASAVVWADESLVIFRIFPDQVIAVDPKIAYQSFTSTLAGSLTETEASRLPHRLQAQLAGAHAGQRVHIIRADDRIASWGFSVLPRVSWPLTETHSRLELEVGAVCLIAFETLPEYRGLRFYPSLLSLILRERFEEGALTAYIWCAPDNVASYGSIKRVGFRETAIHRYRRILGRKTHSEAQWNDVLTSNERTPPHP
jgi:RimJ/RimL family protein N-acetyltransferase